MIDTDVLLSNGRVVRFQIASNPVQKALFVLGVRKSGSSIFNNIVRVLAAKNDYNYVNIAGTFFQQNVLTLDWVNDPALPPLVVPGNVYGGFRNCPTSLLSASLAKESPKVLLVRDPRDGLVSEYFSNAFSHSIPVRSDASSSVTEQMENLRRLALETNINDSVLESAQSFNKTLLGYQEVSRDCLTLTLKYEEVIIDKRSLIEQVCMHFGWTVQKGFVEKILGWADVMPVTEEKQSFIRKVLPGDHIDKLSSQTIGKLNEILRPSMQVFGYA